MSHINLDDCRALVKAVGPALAQDTAPYLTELPDGLAAIREYVYQIWEGRGVSRHELDVNYNLEPPPYLEDDE